jgi:hypothetical protein
METAMFAPTRQMLDEDLQIVRGTLDAILADVRQVSTRAADEVEDAILKLDRARREFARSQ